jgi:phosphopantetheine--protein transferase-like protein
MARASTVLTRSPVPSVPADGSWATLLDELVAANRLHPLEASMARGLPELRRATFVAGRLAMREALHTAAEAGLVDTPEMAILRTARGAPVLPASVSGSITHKQTVAMAAVAPRAHGLQHVGLDLERRPTGNELARPSIARKILTAREFATLDQCRDELAAREHTLVHFAIKEAVYKAIDPFVERYVRFTEVELALRTDGEAEVTLHLPELHDGELRVQAHWQLEDDWIIAQAFSYRG